MVWNSARVSCLQRDWQFRFEPVIVLFHTLNEQFVFPGVINCASFLLPGCKIFLYLYRGEENWLDRIVRRGRFLATSEIFVSSLVISRIFLKRDIKSRNYIIDCIDPSKLIASTVSR